MVALAGGKDKVAAIKGAMQGGYIDVLITDFPTARMLIGLILSSLFLPAFAKNLRKGDCLKSL